MGVWYDPKRNKWCSNFYRSGRMKKQHCKWFETKGQAEKDFNHIKRIYSVRKSNVHDFAGFENRFLKVICLTGKTARGHSTRYIAQNKTDWKFRTITSYQLSKNLSLAGAPFPYHHKYKGYAKSVRQGKTVYQAVLCIDGKNHSLGVFNSAKEAHEAYVAGRDSYYFSPCENVEAYRQHLIKSWTDNAKLRRQKALRSMKHNRKLSYKYIFLSHGGYVCSIKINGEKHRKYSTNLSTVLEYRDSLLKEHNLPIPDNRKD